MVVTFSSLKLNNWTVFQYSFLSTISKNFGFKFNRIKIYYCHENNREFYYHLYDNDKFIEVYGILETTILNDFYQKVKEWP